MWRREDELARITGKWMQWDLLGGTCCWPDSVYTHFFSLSLPLSLFFCRTRIEFSFHLSFFSPLLTGDSISLSSSFQLSKWTNQSPLTSLFFFFSRVHRELCLFSSRSLLLLLFLLFCFFFFFFFIYMCVCVCYSSAFLFTGSLGAFIHRVCAR